MDISILDTKAKITTLEKQLRTDPHLMKTPIKIQKMDLLRHLYEINGDDDKADLMAKEVITIGTTWIKSNKQEATAEMLQAVKNSYFTRAKRHFDEYMIACEWKRSPKARFYLPRRAVLEGQHHITSMIDNFIEDENAEFLGISMPPGTGKLCADDTPVLTDKGFKRHGDLKIGDKVVSPYGDFVKVTHVFPKGVANVRVTFSNGETIDCHENHEWLMYDNQSKTYHIVETKVLFNNCERYSTYSNVEGKQIVKVSNVEYIEPVQGNCIEVEGGLYCVGKTLITTHNSTLIKFLIAYIAGRYPDSASMYVSYSDGMIRMMYDSEVSILTDTDEYCHNEIFGEQERPLEVSAEYATLSYKKRGDFPTWGLVSLGGSVTGRTRANRFLITDDLVKNAEVARSPERLDKLYSDYKATLTTRTIGDNVKQIMLGTIWSVHDPISRMKEEHEGDPAYKFIRIPVWDEATQISNFMYQHPDRYTSDKIQKIKQELDPVLFECMYMSHGIEREGIAFPKDDLSYYDGTLPSTEPDGIFFCADIAWGGGDSLCAPVGYRYGDTVYIHDVIFSRAKKDVTEPMMVSMIMKNRIQRGRIEANNGGDEYADDIRRMLSEKKVICNIETKRASTKMSKEVRIEQFIPEITNNFVFIDDKHATPEYRMYMSELTSFTLTGRNKHDDAADATAMLADFVFSRNASIITRFKRKTML